MRDPIVAALWVDLLGKLAGPATHAVNNALNNVAINLAILQSRPSATAYVERADDYLTEATRLTQAVLALARPVPIPVEPASVLHQLVLVLQAGDRRIEVIDQHGKAITTLVDGAAVRLAIAAVLAEGGASRVHVVRGGEEVRVEGAGLRDDVADAARRAGIGLRVEPGQVTFTFSGAQESA
ncbi:MAG TPA: hypothetical protein VK679_01300 [Gemmatimonadaceae bacterium]|nr:hypothetical protein [Gemmatimonadaceae bacterium]